MPDGGHEADEAPLTLTASASSEAAGATAAVSPAKRRLSATTAARSMKSTGRNSKAAKASNVVSDVDDIHQTANESEGVEFPNFCE